MKRIPVKTKDKLKLDPRTIRVLNDKELKDVKGGDDTGAPHSKAAPGPACQG